MSEAKPLQITREFLLNASLYEPLEGSMVNNFSFYNRTPSIDMYCPVCKGIKTYLFDKAIPPFPRNAKPIENVNLSGATVRYNYFCGGCSRFEAAFFIRFNEGLNSISKVGQYPAIDISIDQETKAKLGVHLELYKKGRICESQSYGIAAFAYYRRIVELLIDELMNEVEDLVEESQREEYRTALDEIKASHHASEKINLIKHLVPSALRPGGSDPLGLLYGVLSSGIHEEDEVDCLEKAHAIRGTLENFIHLLNANKRAAAQFKENLNKLLAPKKAPSKVNA